MERGNTTATFGTAFFSLVVGRKCFFCGLRFEKVKISRVVFSHNSSNCWVIFFIINLFYAKKIITKQLTLLG